MILSDIVTVERLPSADVTLPVHGRIVRPEPALIAQLRDVSSATASATLYAMGVRRTFISGPLPRTPGQRIVGPAVTLQFMPQREDVRSGMGADHAEKSSALWQVFETIEPGDVLVVQAFGDRHTGCVGEMLTTYFKGRGGAGMVVDGCVRDCARIQELDVPLWSVGFTPNYATQAGLMPWGYNVPVACGGVLVLPGDIVIADDDGAVVIPQQLASEVVRVAHHHAEWEDFSRMKLAQGGSPQMYYPLSDEGRREYDEWRRQQTGSP
ncbi:ribonuclease activity regulator RraA [Roseiflexus sp.]|uniref:ribonuclease activity regulator RraA n=1 Tax=Roseiflexus sp. TaxID=2562120 RepID=UPI00398B0F7F